MFQSSAPGWERNEDQRQAQSLPHTAAILGTREDVVSSWEFLKLSSEEGKTEQNSEGSVTRKEHLRPEKQGTLAG